MAAPECCVGHRKLMGFAAHWPKALERNSNILTMRLLDKRKKREKKEKRKKKKKKETT